MHDTCLTTVKIQMVVGLGNPGKRYAGTRHNLGFEVIDLLVGTLAIVPNKRKFGARLGMVAFGDKKLILLKPWRFMNRSGQAVSQAVSFHKLALKDILVVCDDMQLDVGRIRLRAKGSAGGHNGLADIIQWLGTDRFSRLRIGIGKCDEKDAVDYVLEKPTGQERLLLDKALERARLAVLCWIEYGIEQAMNRFNSAKLQVKVRPS